MNTSNDVTVWRQLVAASKKKTGPFYTRYVNRNAALPLTWVFWKMGLHPNAVSATSFLATHAALVMLVVLGATIPIVMTAWLLLALGFVLDSCDGQLARVSGKTSKLGAWLDHSLDIVKLLNLNMAFSYLAISYAFEADAWLTLAWFAALLNLLSQPAHFFVINMRHELLDERAVQQFGEKGGVKKALRVILYGADYGLFILLALILPWMDYFIPLYFAYGIFFMLIFVLHFARTSWHVAKSEG